MLSMTGFGRGMAEKDGRQFTVELKSVNHRFLDLGMRLPRTLSFLEDALRKGIGAKVVRGHVDVFVTYKNERDDAKTVQFDALAAQAYLKAAQQIRDLGVEGKLSVMDVMRLPDVVTITENEEDADAMTQVMNMALELALDQLVKARAEEGARLLDDIESRLVFIEQKRNEIAAREPLVVKEYQEKLSARLAQLLDGVAIDEARLAQEVAIFADKASIAEELTRLLGHIASMRETMASGAPAGRRLDFIVQELNRETNTIGSKASDLAILNLVVDIKAEIEKIREQVQNIE